MNAGLPRLGDQREDCSLFAKAGYVFPGYSGKQPFFLPYIKAAVLKPGHLCSTTTENQLSNLK
jgi:hypothetical protein